MKVSFSFGGIRKTKREYNYYRIKIVKQLAVILLLSLASCKTSVQTFQTGDAHKIGVRSQRFRGTIFTEHYDSSKLVLSAPDVLHRFTPNREEIAKAEELLKRHFEKSYPRKPASSRQETVRNINHYFRQYTGMINQNGERVIHMNMHWDRFTLIDRIKGFWDTRRDFTSEYSLTLDGGGRYWNVFINITTGEVYGLAVNGVG